MLPEISSCHHIFHPFSDKNCKIQLGTKEKIICCSALIFSVFFILPGLAIFYLLTYGYKSIAFDKLQKKFLQNSIDSDLSVAAHLISKVSSTVIPAKQAGNDYREAAKTFIQILKKEEDGSEVLKDLEPGIHPLEPKKFDKILNRLLKKSKDKELIDRFTNSMSRKAIVQFLKKYNDLTLFFGEKKLPMHKELLCLYIPYFEPMLRSGFAEALSSKIVMDKSVSRELFFSVLVFQLTKKIRIRSSNVKELLAIAEPYQLDDLKKICEAWLIRRKSKISEKKLFAIAATYNLESTKALLFEKVLKRYSTKPTKGDRALIKKLGPEVRVVKLPHLSDEQKDFLFSHMPALESICVKKLTAQTVQSLLSLPHLREVNFDSVEVCSKKSIFSLIDHLEIAELDASCEAYKSARFFAHFLSGKQLDLSNFPTIKDEDLVNIPREVESLRLANCQITNAGLSDLPQSLTHLDLTNCKISDDGILLLPTTIRSLNLSNTKIKNVRSIPKGIRELDLSHCKHLKDWSELPEKIERLVLQRCTISSDMLLNLPSNIKELDISYCKAFGPMDFEHLPDSLLTLDVSNCKNLVNPNFLRLPRLLKNLRLCNLDLNNLDNLPETLTSLDLAGCKHLHGDAFKTLPVSIRTLILANCKKITGEELKLLPPKLKQLDLSNCSFLDKEKLSDLPSSLVYLNLTNVSLAMSTFDMLPKSLCELDLTGCEIEDTGSQDLETLPEELWNFKSRRQIKRGVAKIKRWAELFT